MTKKIIIGTRGSVLALAQTDIVSRALLAVEPSLTIEVRSIETRGDKDLAPIPLNAVGKGWFTKEIERALLAGEIDLAVHSLKDMAEDMPDGLHNAAYLERGDARDALITKRGEPMEDLPPGAVIGTDSLRRQVQMRALRPDVTMKSVRGNVQTRLAKLADEPYDAVILAAAGLKRLGLDGRVARYFETREMTPAPGQGVLAVQARGDDASLQSLLARVNDTEAAHAAGIERSFARAAGGGCKEPVGAYAWREGSDCRLVGMVSTAGGERIARGESRAPWDGSEWLGDALARKLMRELH